jgi:hypothetical protein
VLAGVTWVRDELLPEQWRRFHVIDLLPSWPWYLWLTIGIFIVVFAIGEGVFRHHRLIEDAKSRHKPLFDSFGKLFQPLPTRGKVSSVIIPTVIALVIAILWIVFPAPRASLKREQNPAAKPTETPTAIYMELPLQNLTQRVDSYPYANHLLQTHRL